jgi:hypothetical protein
MHQGQTIKNKKGEGRGARDTTKTKADQKEEIKIKGWEKKEETKKIIKINK